MVHSALGRALAAAWAVASLGAAAAQAQPIRPEDIPPELRTWSAWVLDDVPEHVCPVREGAAQCLWPGHLRLDLTGSGGQFRQDVRVDRDLTVALPGGRESWPQDVTVDGHRLPVMESDGAPSVRLTAGSHTLTGRFGWHRMPDSMPVPPRTGIVTLRMEGALVPFPAREQSGLLWLRRGGSSQTAEADRLRVQVFRKISDGIPVFVDTTLVLDVSGKAREVALTGAALADSEPVAARGALPVQLDPNGRLRVQVRSGRYSVSVLSRLTSNPKEIKVPAHAEPWPDDETWVFQANEHLRQVRVTGGRAIDASRTDLPAAWRKLPAVTLSRGDGLVLEELMRGQPQADPDRVRLGREMWLDLDGQGLTVRDTFSGSLGGTTRLDMLAPARIGRARVGKGDELITSMGSDAPTGIEVRNTALDVLAESRRPLASAMPAVGWDVDVDRLSARLHLPPGWRLLGATGADTVYGSWLSDWTLIDAFLVFLLALGIGRLFGWRVGLLSLAAIALSYHETGAPRWSWIVLIAAVAWWARAPEGKLRHVARALWWLGAALLVIALVPFVKDQALGALYPHIMPRWENTAGMYQRAFAPLAMQVPAKTAPRQEVTLEKPQGVALQAPLEERDEESRPEAPPPPPPPPPAARIVAPSSASEAFSYADKTRRSKGDLSSWTSNLMQDPHSVLQTGPGVPRWTWQEARLSWTGSVPRTQQVRLVLLSPWETRIFALVRLVLVLAFAAWLLGWRRWPPLGRWMRRSAATTTMAAAILTILGAGVASAETPSPKLLEQLKQRLTRPPACGTACIDTARLALNVDAERLRLTAEVHAQAKSTWTVPGPVGSWLPAAVRVDGQAATALALLDDGFLHVRLEPGVHQIEAVGPLPPVNDLTLQLQDRPRRATAHSVAWEVVGVRDGGPPDASVQLTRRLKAGTPVALGGGQLPAWLQVERRLEIGVTWYVHTTVRRVSPPGTPVAVRIPLIEGEAVTEGDWNTENGALALSLSRDQTEASWSSTIEPRESLTLTALDGTPWSEVWKLSCGVVWHCDFEGLPPVQRAEAGVIVPELRPWPGEKATLRFRRPRGVAGATLTVDHAGLVLTTQTRRQVALLTIDARASREETLEIGLPDDAQIKAVSVGGAPRPIRPDGRRLSLSLPPGATRVQVQWHHDRGLGLLVRAPQVALSAPAANVDMTVSVPLRERFAVATWGPAWGPVVLFWPLVVLVVVLAIALGRIPLSPLRTHHWLILGLGLTQAPWPFAAAVLAFPLAMAWRARQTSLRPPRARAVQILLGAYALVVGLGLLVMMLGGLSWAPDMAIAQQQSTASSLHWYADRVDGPLPAVAVVMLPVWLFRAAMLAWALWLILGVLRGARWGWHAFAAGGLWPRRPKDSGAPTPPADIATDTNAP